MRVCMSMCVCHMYESQTDASKEPDVNNITGRERWGRGGGQWKPRPFSNYGLLAHRPSPHRLGWLTSSTRNCFGTRRPWASRDHGRSGGTSLSFLLRLWCKGSLISVLGDLFRYSLLFGFIIWCLFFLSCYSYPSLLSMLCYMLVNFVTGLVWGESYLCAGISSRAHLAVWMGVSC